MKNKKNSISLNPSFTRGTCKQKGFTLIEILVVVAVVGFIVLSISRLMSGVFSSQNKNKAIDKVDQSGSWVLNELKKNILNANSDGGNFICPPNGVGTSISIISNKDLQQTILSCSNIAGVFKISSYSATRNETIVLFEKNNDLELVSCSDFIRCEVPYSKLSSVKFTFTLKAGVSTLSSGTTRPFLMDVVLRD